MVAPGWDFFGLVWFDNCTIAKGVCEAAYPIVFLKSAMRTRGSERASREAKAVHWRTFGFILDMEKTNSDEKGEK